MSGLTAADLFLACVVALVVWFLRMVGMVVGARLAERFAVWMLPDKQATTYRAATTIARLARWLMPREVVVCRNSFRQKPYKRLRNVITIWRCRIERRSVEWRAPDAALSELEWALKAEVRQIKPVRLVAPLFVIAARLRLTNARQRAFFAFCSISSILFGMALTLQLAVVFGAALPAGIIALLGEALERRTRAVRVSQLQRQWPSP